jgi:hypothetical protein
MTAPRDPVTGARKFRILLRGPGGNGWVPTSFVVMARSPSHALRSANKHPDLVYREMKAILDDDARRLFGPAPATRDTSDPQPARLPGDAQGAEL